MHSLNRNMNWFPPCIPEMFRHLNGNYWRVCYKKHICPERLRMSFGF
jgi:hypothetical protein